MNSFTFTPTSKQAIGFSSANAKAKSLHEKAQSVKPENERTSYLLTDEQYAHAALGRVGDSYYNQLLEEAGEAKWDFILAVAAKKHIRIVAEKLADLEKTIEELNS